MALNEEGSGPVLIVGAGPVGLTAALRLARSGIACHVFEAAASIPYDLRASTFHPPTLDMLEEFDLAQPLIEQGRICPTWQVRMHETGECAEFDLSLISDATGHPYRLQCEQWKLCELLLAKLESFPHATVSFDSEVVGCEQDETGVCLSVVEAGGDARQVHGRFAIAADGARSKMRKLLGLSLEGKTYPETTILVTTQFPFEDHLPGLSNVNYVWIEQGTYSLLHLPDRWRCSLYPDAGESLEDAQLPASIERKLQRIVARDEPYEVLDQRAYRVHMRIVDQYRVGRVALAGDAAHINSPSGGMGMNGGIHDAFALVDAIRDILAGAPLERLDQYTAQRRPVAADAILAQANRNRSRMQERDPARRRETLAQLQQLSADPAAAREHLLRTSMIEGLRISEQVTA